MHGIIISLSSLLYLNLNDINKNSENILEVLFISSNYPAYIFYYLY